MHRHKQLRSPVQPLNKGYLIIYQWIIPAQENQFEGIVLAFDFGMIKHKKELTPFRPA